MTTPSDSNPSPPRDSAGFSGRRRSRTTKVSVKVMDGVARFFITVGGFGTIVAVTAVFLFLVWVVWPIFADPDVEEPSVAEVGWAAAIDLEQIKPLHVAVDDYNLMTWAVYSDGMIRAFDLRGGTLLEEIPVSEDATMTAWSFPQRGSQVAFGFDDGTIRLGTIEFDLSFVDREFAPEPLRDLEPLESAVYENGVAQMTREAQVRILNVKYTIGEPIQTGSESPIRLMDLTGSADRPILAYMSDDDRVSVTSVRIRRNMMTGRETYTTTEGEVPYEPKPVKPSHLKLSGLGDNVYLVWADGTMQRYDTRTLDNLFFVEQMQLVEPGTELTSIAFLIGKTTILVGDSQGDVTAWFRTRPEGAETPDNLRMTQIQRLPGDGAGPVTAITSSQRKRMIAVGHADGRVRMHNVTNERFLLESDVDAGKHVDRIVLNPRDNGLVALAGPNMYFWNIEIPHPEVSVRAIFGNVWYEGYSEPAKVWQSTGGTDDFESKYSLTPLIFGTIKATFYCMLMGVPLALLAAIYTSEFLNPKMKSAVKPTVEMMASLPSVVLGFLAALVVAPFIETVIPATLVAFVTIPFTFLLASYVWQMLPSTYRMRFVGYRMVFLFLTLPIGILLAGWIGPLAERLLFAVHTIDVASGQIIETEYNVRLWLSAKDGPQFQSSALGGWMFLTLPLSILITAFTFNRFVNPILMQTSAAWSWGKLSNVDMVKFLAGAVFTILVSVTIAGILTLIGDPRGSYIDTYVQRNALVVGFIMGFAVIPIIYTIADDAMSAVPEHLRSASLGAGATKWQTAVRIIIPTAMSGLFSAVMIGFGRAVGETMIVLMAAGNTPVMDWNIFNGFRTLSANIAVEMMEAVKDSTNYRMLFLAALTLFLMTFALNTVAEIVRLRYRKRAFQL